MQAHAHMPVSCCGSTGGVSPMGQANIAVPP
ncbi:hypothetical protein GXY_14003 [Novacetimonas hansenii ATCC 23769]|uniref:Uncharacterized protein n=1 Tax=Novacetimonas hansenii ATCC 23769 TaxID=714995 RepID=D5QI20_NOVHA|nr:hypothetical protein GXY_14003 [Novacetimonas hansenii ATCC 23769]